MKFFSATICLAVLAALAGCRTQTVPIEVTVPGEFNLQHVSKLALLDFNSLPGDRASCDPATVELVRKLVSDCFYDPKFYPVADLDLEKLILEEHPSARVGKRFDALLYGKVWYLPSPEFRGEVPKVLDLEKWIYRPYTAGYGAQRVRLVAKLTESEYQELALLPYRIQRGTLMLTLTLWRVDRNGTLDKVSDTFALAEQEYRVENGKFTARLVPLDGEGGGADSGAGQTIPPELELTTTLGRHLAARLVKKFSPSTVRFEAPVDTADAKLAGLLKNRAWNAARDDIVSRLLGGDDPEAVRQFAQLDFAAGARAIVRRANPNLAGEQLNDAGKRYLYSNRSALYALGIAEEGAGNPAAALAAYRAAFELEPKQEYADGISRTLYTLGMRGRLAEKAELKREAEQKTIMQHNPNEGENNQ